ncbi:MAG: hypothetical protein L0Z50_36940 [Verrucomicrobiales bacterium]|nr:hypothetical protein [Verrucomicrobiales bacterium]
MDQEANGTSTKRMKLSVDLEKYPDVKRDLLRIKKIYPQLTTTFLVIESLRQYGRQHLGRQKKKLKRKNAIAAAV